MMPPSILKPKSTIILFVDLNRLGSPEQATQNQFSAEWVRLPRMSCQSGPIPNGQRRTDVGCQSGPIPNGQCRADVGCQSGPIPNEQRRTNVGCQSGPIPSNAEPMLAASPDQCRMANAELSRQWDRSRIASQNTLWLRVWTEPDRLAILGRSVGTEPEQPIPSLCCQS